MLLILYMPNHRIGFDEFHFWTATILPRRVTTSSTDSHQLKLKWSLGYLGNYEPTKLFLEVIFTMILNIFERIPV